MVTFTNFLSLFSAPGTSITSPRCTYCSRELYWTESGIKDKLRQEGKKINLLHKQYFYLPTHTYRTMQARIFHTECWYLFWELSRHKQTNKQWKIYFIEKINGNLYYRPPREFTEMLEKQKCFQELIRKV